MTDPRLRRLARRIQEIEEVLLHTGPGLLTETKLPAVDLAETVWGTPDGRFGIERYETAPEALWADWLDFWADRSVPPASVSPQPVHERIDELVDCGHVSVIVTENVFGLTRDAGVPADRCIEFHGRIDEARCDRCDRTYDVTPTQAAGNRRCPACGRTLAPGIVLAGEPPAKTDRLRAWSWADSCDLYLAAGTRFAVSPTDENAEHAVDTGAELAVIANRPTLLDDDADHRLWTDPASGLSRLRDAIAVLR